MEEARPENSCAELVSFLLCMSDELRLYHWRTRSHARHKATCQALSELSGLVDSLVETFMGRYERPSYRRGFVELSVRELTDETAEEAARAYCRWLKSTFPHLVKEHDTDLLNLRDEVLASLHRLLYQFTLL
jgi:Family of unknown function (DUF5856)